LEHLQRLTHTQDCDIVFLFAVLFAADNVVVVVCMVSVVVVVVLVVLVVVIIFCFCPTNF
jgi:hypothetical protein